MTGVDAEPVTEEEEAWARAYWDVLAVGAAEPDASHLDPERVAAIRAALDDLWRQKVRRITRRRRTSA